MLKRKSEQIAGGVKRFVLGVLPFLLLIASVYSCRQNRGSVPPKPDIEIAKSIADSDTIVVKGKEYYMLSRLFDAANRNGFNGNVLIARKGKVLYRDSWGYADMSKRELLNLDSKFQLASVSKQFTAVAIMLLKEQGKLSYADPVQKHLPEFPYKDITIDLLLSHRSGLPNYVYFCDHLCKDRETPVSNSSVLNLMQTCKPEPYFKPGKRFQYSNTNYCILALIVERASGLSYRDFLHNYLFKPADMRETEVFSLLDTMKIENSVKGHYANGRYVKYNYLNGVVGDKGLYSTVTDLFKWDKALFSGKIISKETLDGATLPSADIKRDGSSYGYGYRLKYLNDTTKLVFHGGWWQGFKTCYLRIPKDETLIIVLTNVANRGFSMSMLLDAYAAITPEFSNPYSNQKFSRDSISF